MIVKILNSTASSSSSKVFILLKIYSRFRLNKKQTRQQRGETVVGCRRKKLDAGGEENLVKRRRNLFMKTMKEDFSVRTVRRDCFMRAVEN